MKSKTWALILGAVLAVCVVLSIWVLLPGEQATMAEIWSDGKLLKTVSLTVDQKFTVESQGGVNVITVKDGKIAVTEADCPDHYCMDRGYCNSGVQIVCLPNRLVIKFLGRTEVDSVAG